jgi:hypothetical protein
MQDLKENAVEAVRKVCNFLKVESSFVPNLTKNYNIFRVSDKKIYNFINRSAVLKNALKKVLPRENIENIKNRTLTATSKPELSNEVKDHLKELYKRDIQKLRRILEIDLSNW